MIAYLKLDNISFPSHIKTHDESYVKVLRLKNKLFCFRNLKAKLYKMKPPIEATHLETTPKNKISFYNVDVNMFCLKGDANAGDRENEREKE
jgi:hypothetical protein